MAFSGHGLLLRLPFADNGVLSNNRTFLLIGEEDKYILLLNVSSIKGKEHKLLLSSNEEIKKYNPPFKMKSMIKFDALYKVEKCSELNSCILCDGKTLDPEEFERLFKLYVEYKKVNSVTESITSAIELKKYRSGLK